MQHPGFFERAGPFSLNAIAAASGAKLQPNCDGETLIEDVGPLRTAGRHHVTFLSNPKYLASLAETRAGACIVAESHAANLPLDTAALTAVDPYQAFARTLTLFYADALRSKAARPAIERSALVDPTAEIATNVVVEPGAIVGREAIIGAGTVIAAGAVVGYRVVVGANSYIGPNCTVTHAIIGNNVIIHSGVCIGQDGFGFSMGRNGHEKIPQIGRVIIGDDVEVGANSTIDRGSLLDTEIGAGTKIDNLVQIGHNVVIGRHCIIVAQSGIAGSSKLEDFVVMGAHSGVLGHVTIGRGAHIAGMAHVKDDVPPNSRMGGTPAVPFDQWARQLAAIKGLGRKRLPKIKD